MPYLTFPRRSFVEALKDGRHERLRLPAERASEPNHRRHSPGAHAIIRILDRPPGADCSYRISADIRSTCQTDPSDSRLLDAPSCSPAAIRRNAIAEGFAA